MTVAKTVDVELDRDLRLETLAIEANTAHEGAEAMAQTALEYAHTAGEKLAEAKGLVGHGKWLAWLEANFRGSRRTASRYLQLADNWEQLTNGTRVSHLSVRQALELLAEPKDEPEEVAEPTEPDDEPEIVPPPSGLIKQFGDPKLLRSWEAHELSTDLAVLVGRVKTECGELTYEALWEQRHADAKVRRSEPQLKHLLEQAAKGQTDEQTAFLVECVENGEAKSVFDVHKIRQAERKPANPFDDLNDEDQRLAHDAARDITSGHGGEDSLLKVAADIKRLAEERDDWTDLNLEQKRAVLYELFGKKQAASYKSSRPKAKPKYKNKAEFFEVVARLRATPEDRAEYEEHFGEAL